MYIILLALFIISSCSARGYTGESHCLNDAAARRIAHNYASLASSYNDADADRFTTPGTKLIADSTNTMINLGCPNGPAILSDPVYTSREWFKKGQSQQPNIPFEIIDVRHDCTSVTFRWVSRDPVGKGKGQRVRVRGIILVDVVKGKEEEEPWLIDTVYSEFNTAVFLRDGGAIEPRLCDEKGVGKRRNAYRPPEQ